jgi:hypothetical protein
MKSNFAELKRKIKDIFSKQEPAPIIKQNNQTAKGAFKTFTIDGKPGYGPLEYLNLVRSTVTDTIKQEWQEGIKARLVLICEMKKTNHKTGEIMNAQPHFTTILKEEDVPHNDLIEKMHESQETYQTMGSGWVFVRVIQLDILIDKYVPLCGSSYIPLPKFLADKTAIINVKNKDDECFKWAVTHICSISSKTMWID